MIGWAVSISDSRYQAHLESGHGHQMPGIRYRIYQIYQIRNIGCQISGYPMQVIGYRVQMAKSIYLRLREQNSPLSTLWQRELEVRSGEIGDALYRKEEKTRSGRMALYLTVLFVLLLEDNCNRVCKDVIGWLETWMCCFPSIPQPAKLQMKKWSMLFGILIWHFSFLIWLISRQRISGLYFLV